MGEQEYHVTCALCGHVATWLEARNNRWVEVTAGVRLDPNTAVWYSVHICPSCLAHRLATWPEVWEKVGQAFADQHLPASGQGGEQR
jgi:hypothetical protein